MKRLFETFVVLSLVALIAAPAAAQEEKKAKKKPQAKGRQGQVIAGPLAAQLEKANLTDEQKKQIEDIKAKYAPKAAEARQAVGAVLTRENRQARNEARKKAQEDGKKGAELKAAVDAAAPLSDEQKEQLAKAETQMKEVQTAIRKDVLAVLTDEQKQQLGLNKAPGAKKKNKKAA
jgi:Spy/CpxP family protein refolding chaperone